MSQPAVLLTEAGYRQLLAELEHLRTSALPAAAARLEQARAFGDLRENAEYAAAQEERQRLTARLAELADVLGRATLVAIPSRGETDVVGLGLPSSAPPGWVCRRPAGGCGSRNTRVVAPQPPASRSTMLPAPGLAAWWRPTAASAEPGEAASRPAARSGVPARCGRRRDPQACTQPDLAATDTRPDDHRDGHAGRILGGGHQRDRRWLPILLHKPLKRWCQTGSQGDPTAGPAQALRPGRRIRPGEKGHRAQIEVLRTRHTHPLLLRAAAALMRVAPA